MIFWLVKPLRFLVSTLREQDSHHRIAYGIALGMVVGLVPKDNLTAVILGTLLFSLRVNLAAGICSALVCSWAGILADPLANRIGLYLLTLPDLQQFWLWLYRQPLMPWTDFNDTAVLGNLILGCWLFYPVYRISKYQVKKLLDRWGEKISEQLDRYKIYQALFGADLVSSWRLRG